LALGRACLALGRNTDALSALREAALLAPGSPEIALGLGEALVAGGALPTAVAELQRALRLDPGSLPARLSLAKLWLEAGEPGKAEAELSAAEALGADCGALRQAIAEHRGLQRASPAYVRNLFDQFAADYDERMRTRLGYTAPETLHDLCALLLGPPHKRLDVLDLGCGTGLSGMAIAPYAKRLIGVDLSPKMLAKAHALSLYDELLLADVEVLPEQLSGFDLVLAADVLVYLGDLAKIFALVRTALNRGGLWAFTVERSDAEDFVLGRKRRYRHSEAYLRTLAAAHDYEIASLIPCVVRHDAGVPVESLAAVYRAAVSRPASKTP
jgi:predicted TPR repeat methyltransferase